MNKVVFVFSALLTLGCLSNNMNAQQDKTGNKYFDWSFNPNINNPVDNPNVKKLSLIEVKGNKFVNAQGDTILFRGVAIADTDKIDQERHWNKTLFIKVKEFGATIVGIPIHPAAWRARTPAKYLPLLEQTELVM